MSNNDLVLSIIVACRNERHHIRVLLACILSQKLQGVCWEAIVADGCSNDGTREILDTFSAEHPQIRVITNERLIVSTGLNAALSEARGTVVIRMDAHTRYNPDYCALCLETLRHTGCDNVGGPVRMDVGDSRVSQAVAAAFHSRFSSGGARFHNVTYEGFVDTIPYGCWRKELLLRIGGFDEELVRNQDDELNLRLTRRGGRIWQNPRIQSWYTPRRRFSQLFQQHFQYGFWKVAVIRKHAQPASFRHLVPAAWLSVNVLFLIAICVAWLKASQVLSSELAIAWICLLALYGVCTTSASIIAAKCHGWSLLPYLPLIFAVIHFAYGSGFALGLIALTHRSSYSTATVADSAVAKLTR